MAHLDPIICCKNIQNEGSISFGAGCVVHPDCCIIAEPSTKIVFADHCIIEEKVRIINRVRLNEEGKPIEMHIGSFNLFEVGCVVDSSNIGSYNLFEHRSVVQPFCSIGNNCLITATCVIKSGTKMPDGVVMYGEDRFRTNPNTSEEAFRQNIKGLADELARSLPKFNQIQTMHR